MDRHKMNPFSLRIDRELKAKAESEARQNRRSLNTELAMLIEEGLKWRETQSRQAKA